MEMTDKEIIKYLEEHGHIADEVKDRAIAAIRLQMPRKAVEDEPSKIRYVQSYTCPTCLGAFSGTGTPFCYHCGQKLKYAGREDDE